MSDLHSPGGRARAATATRGDGGQFMPAESQQEPSTSTSSDVSSNKRVSRTKALSLQSLYLDTEWWTGLGIQYPNVDLHHELLKALDWHRAHLVKSPKLFFRNWVERAALSSPSRVVELTPVQARERLRVVS